MGVVPAWTHKPVGTSQLGTASLVINDLFLMSLQDVQALTVLSRWASSATLSSDLCPNSNPDSSVDQVLPVAVALVAAITR